MTFSFLCSFERPCFHGPLRRTCWCHPRSLQTMGWGLRGDVEEPIWLGGIGGWELRRGMGRMIGLGGVPSVQGEVGYPMLQVTQA